MKLIVQLMIFQPFSLISTVEELKIVYIIVATLA